MTDNADSSTSSVQSIPPQVAAALANIQLPKDNSHKGQNGKLLIIGGSELFHAASKWSLDIASKFVDMVFYSSIPSNNQLITEAKQHFWNGIVISRDVVEDYIDEADCILIGPGMTRSDDTAQITNHLLEKYPNKKWVIDAGALQMMDPKLLTETMIITPHTKELERIEQAGFSKENTKATILLKGKVDQIIKDNKTTEIEGGNPGMTKGGTGDVLAGLLAALYCTHDAITATTVASYINKAAGDKLYEEVGPYFNASDLVGAIPEIFWLKLHVINM